MMNLENKNAVIYGAGGSLGGAVAKAFAAAGARVFLTGKNYGSVNAVTRQIIDSGGKAVTDMVDALDEKAINAHIKTVVEKAGTIDISFNATGDKVVQNIPLVNMNAGDFLQPVTFTMKTQFLTATAAAKVMMKQGSGVILTLTATPGGIGYPYTGGFAPSCCALECFSKNLASELGVFGIRVVNIRSGGSPDSKVFKDAIESYPEEMVTILGKMKADTMLKAMPMMEDIAHTATFLASSLASKITGVTIDLTCGTTSALNYRVVSATGDGAGTNVLL
jgi:NAD(P)-dependent dehydrogenase (short-subunit alcohol dehydrogenase family)